MKTNLDYLKELPEPQRSLALGNYDEEFAKGIPIATSHCQAISYAFYWVKTREGRDYWAEVCMRPMTPYNPPETIESP